MRGDVVTQGLRKVKRRDAGLVLLTVCLVLAVGCADKPTYEFDYDLAFPFGGYQTYRWYDDDHNSRESQYRRRNSSDQRVRNTADQELVQRGFREAPRGAADFWVNYHVTKRQTQRVSGQEQGMHGGVGVGTYGKSVSVGYSSGPSVKTYEDGTAVFDVIDIRSGKIVWRGVAEGRLKNKMSKADKEQLTITVVHELLNQFPPG
ncbi:MAG: DUF4136 domain-containing protein [Luminiphilus sp.]|nr:DUF4136 domain-containing protein [Luminiphilus sp.]